VAKSSPTHHDLEPEVGEGRGDDLLAAVVPVLPDLRDEDAGPRAMVLREARRHAADARDGRTVARGTPVHARDELRHRGVAAPGGLERRRDLADRRMGPAGVHGERQEVAGAVPGRAGQRRQRSGDAGRVALRPEPGELGQLRLAHRRIVDPEHIEGRLEHGTVAVDPHHHLGSGVDPRLLRIDRHRGDAHPPGRADDPAGDLATACDQDLREQRIDPWPSRLLK